ncbi:ATP-dependent DNA helicase [Trichonephila clavipes]|nr:ATP-dependent DNA helicase [Trichonephila clavipes]
MSIIDTGGLPYETVFVKDIYYMITTNIDVSDGLANGADGKLVHIERDDSGQVNFVWLEFSDSPKTGQKFEKVAGHVAANNISRTAVPIGRRSSTIPLNNNKNNKCEKVPFAISLCLCNNNSQVSRKYVLRNCLRI